MGGIIREIQDGDGLRYLRLGDETFNPLKIFLRQHALKFHKRHIAKTYVVVDQERAPKRALAYLTLICSEIQNSFDPSEDHQDGTSHYSTLPAVKLARMAVDVRHRGLGRHMMDWCIAHVINNVSPYVGCRFLVVDAKNESVGFYKKVGFTMLDTKENRKSNSPIVFIDLYKVNQQLNQDISSQVHQHLLDI